MDVPLTVNLYGTMLSAIAKDDLVALPATGRTIVQSACRVIIICITQTVTVIPDCNYNITAGRISCNCIDGDILIASVASVVCIIGILLIYRNFYCSCNSTTS